MHYANSDCRSPNIFYLIDIQAQKNPAIRLGLFWLPKDGAQGRTRTTDTRIFSPLLYQLSYLGKSDFRLRLRSVPCGTSGVIQTPLGLV